MGIEPRVYILLALLLLVLPIRWLVAAVLAAAFHEGCHMAAVYLLGGRCDRIRLSAQGARLEATLPAFRGELLAILAGPAGSLLLMSLYRVLPRVAVCAAVQGFYNLLPIEPLDGGRALRLCLEHWCPNRAEKIMTVVRFVLLGGIVAAAYGISYCNSGGFGVQ